LADEHKTTASASSVAVAEPSPDRGSDEAGAHTPGDVASGSSDYDLGAALRAVNRVHYGDCTVPSAGKLAITFAPSGRVKRVALVRGDYDEQTTACIAARFGTAKISPFDGTAQTVTADVTSTR
jgi:hypothetical protein